MDTKRINIQIPEGVYDAYLQAPEKLKLKAEIEIGNLLKSIFRKHLDKKLQSSILRLRKEAKQNGLTNEGLDLILKDIEDERTAEIRL